MRNRVAVAFAVGIAGGLLAQSANATNNLVFSDNFDSDSPVILNWGGDAIFQSIPQPGDISGLPSIDLVGVGDGYGSLAYHGNSVDLDGSTGTGFTPAGELQSIQTLGAGNFTVEFLLAGNNRGAPNQTTQVSIGTQSFDITPTSNSQWYTPYTLTFLGASGQLSFTDLGPATQQGDLIDNIAVFNAVPETSTWAMMLLGFAGLGFAGYRRAKTGRLSLSQA